MNRVSFGQIIEILRAATEILLRVGSMSEGKLPSFIQTDGLTLRPVFGCLRCT